MENGFLRRHQKRRVKKTTVKEPKRHHFVPKMLLRNFTDKSGFLYFFDRRFLEKCVRKTIPDNFGLEKNLYTEYDEQGNKDNSAEELFADLEGKTAEIFRKIINAARAGEKSKLTASEKQTLNHYIYCQWGRVPDTTDPILNRDLKESDSKQKLISRMAPEERKRFEKKSRVKSLIRSVAEPNEKILRIFEGKGLAVLILRKSKKSFVIGTNPVLRIPTDLHLADSKAESWLPIAYDVAITPYFPHGAEKLFDRIEDQDIRGFNKTILKQSSAIAGRSEKLISSLINDR